MTANHADDPDATRIRAAQLSEIVDQVPAIIAWLDNDLVCRFANRFAVRWTALESAEQVVGRPMHELMPADIYEHDLPFAQRALHGESQQFHRRFVDDEGTVWHTQVTYAPHVTETGIDGIYLHIADITDRINAEHQARVQAGELAGLREREQIARRLNDVIVRRLFAVSISLSAALQDDDDSARERIAAAVNDIDATISTLRSSLYRRPS